MTTERQPVAIVASIRFAVMAATVAALLIGSVASYAGEPTRVLFIGKGPDHPWGTHMYLHASRVLAQCVKRSGHVETTVANEWPKDERVLRTIDTMVVYTDPGAERLLDGPHRETFRKLMRRGVGLVTIHWASTVRKENFQRLGPEWMRILGGTWISNVGLSTEASTLRRVAPDHPISRGWKTSPFRDEFYLNPKLGPHATPILEVTAKGKPLVVGWAYERPEGGRSFATTLGHFYDNFVRDDFRRIVVNAILWSAHRDVPAGGAPVDLTDKELALPAQPAAPK